MAEKQRKKKLHKCLRCGSEWEPCGEDLREGTATCPFCSAESMHIREIVKDAGEAPELNPRFGRGLEESKDEVAEIEKIEEKLKEEVARRKEKEARTKRRRIYSYISGKSVDGIMVSGEKPDEEEKKPAQKKKLYSYLSEDSGSGEYKPSTTSSMRDKKTGQRTGDLISNATSGCFIVTATYGSASYEKIDVFYRFRDDFLLQRKWGRTATKIYYRLSPYPAAAIRKSATLKKASRFALDRLSSLLRKRFSV